tara:strand:- start:3352 stop:3843 length:492 start_codon:yes stop_codon:yes gene_type:complete
MPFEGMLREKYLIKKFGSKNNADLIYERIKEEGKKNKIFFQFSNIKKTPNSFLSHKLLAYAYKKKKQINILGLLFYSYFIEGKDIGNLSILIEIAKKTKIYDKYFEKYILSDQDNQNLLNDENEARNIGVKGVPCFIFNKKFVINGAQSKDNFIKVINSLNYV